MTREEIRTIEQLLWYIDVLRDNKRRESLEKSIYNCGIAGDYFIRAISDAKEIVKQNKVEA